MPEFTPQELEAIALAAVPLELRASLEAANNAFAHMLHHPDTDREALTRLRQVHDDLHALLEAFS